MADAPVGRDTIYRIAGTLEEARVPFAFIGGVALGAWGIPRATFDLDVAIALDGTSLETVFGAFERRGLVLDPVFSRGFRDRVGGMEKVHVHVPTGATLLAVDVFLAGSPFLKSVLIRRRTVDLGRGPVPICTAADLILFKLIADRWKDRADIENLISIQGVPEREYLEKWAEELGVRDRLERTLKALG
jgi:hypothetical protein